MFADMHHFFKKSSQHEVVGEESSQKMHGLHGCMIYRCKLSMNPAIHNWGSQYCRDSTEFET